jgi:hypothetical protein
MAFPAFALIRGQELGFLSVFFQAKDHVAITQTLSAVITIRGS